MVCGEKSTHNEWVARGRRRSWFVYGYSVRKLLFGGGGGGGGGTGGGTRVHSKRRVITLHPVASVCFTKPDTGGQACQASRVGGSGGVHGGVCVCVCVEWG